MLIAQHMISQKRQQRIDEADFVTLDLPLQLFLHYINYTLRVVVGNSAGVEPHSATMNIMLRCGALIFCKSSMA